MRSATDDDQGIMQLKERFESFLSVMCDAFLGWDASRGREAKHSRRFLRMTMRYLHADVDARVVKEGGGGAPAGQVACEAIDVASAVAASGQRNGGQYAERDTTVDVRGHEEMRSCGFEVERVAGEVVAADVTRVDVAGWKENTDNDEDAPASEALYLGVKLEEQCVCEWSGIRIPAVLGGMLSALSSPVDVLLDALSSADTCDGDAAAVVFAELESLCTGRAGDADTVCGAIVSKRSVYGAGLDVGLLRLWLRSLPDAVCCDFFVLHFCDVTCLEK
jgi:hypothetical protein